MNFKFLMIMCMAILLVGSVSAFEFDNVKDYDPIMREVTITNAYGLGDEIGKARLNTPLNVIVGAGYQKVAEFDLWAYEDYNDAIKQFTFTDLKKKEKINRNFDIKYKTIVNTEIDDFKFICSVDPKSINETKICEEVKTGSHFEDLEEWVKVTPADLKKNEILIIGIFTNVQKGDYVDWIPTIYGVEIKEWATWTEDLNTNALLWYNMNEPSGATAYDFFENYNGTINGVGYEATGKINRSFSFINGGNDYVATGLSDGSSATWKSVSLWFKTSDGTQVSRSLFGSCIAGFTICRTIDLRVEGGDQAVRLNRIEHGVADNQFYKFTYGDNVWHHVVYSESSVAGMKLYIDGYLRVTDAGRDFTGLTYTQAVGNRDNFGTINQGFTGQLDLFGVWDRILDDDGCSIGNLCGGDIEVLFNGGNATQPTYTYDADPIIIFNAPASANFTSPQILTFNFTAWDGINLSDVKVYVDTILNQTNASGINNSVYLFDLNFGEGDYTIYGQATDNESQATNSSEIRIVIDGTAPTIILNSPISEEITATIPKNSTLNVTTADTHLSTCWYYTSDNSTNITYTCNTAINISFTTGGYKSIYAFVNDTFGNENSTSTTYLINYIQEGATYDATIVEAESHTIILNITALEITSFNGTLHYNGTDYTPTVTTSGNTSLLTSTLTAPGITANELVYFNWTYTLNGVDYNSSTYNQTIIFLTPLVISASCSDKALRFDLQDEGNLSSFSGEVEYNFKYGISNGSLKTVHGSLTGVTTFYACINATVSENYTLGYGEIQYRDGIYVDRRYYLFEGQTISNNTLTNHTLRDLLLADQTSFLLTMEDTSLNVYSEKYTALWRWYPDLDEYQIVGMGKTDDDGETVAHVQTEDVDYRVGLYDIDGTLIKLDNPRRFVCTSAPCSLTIRVGAGDVDYSSVFDVQAEITYDEGVFLLIYNDPNQLTSEMRFLVTRETGTNTLIICNDTSSGFSGAMSCNTSIYNGLKKAVAYRSASPELPIAQKVVSSINKTFNSGFGLFISVILWLAIVLSGFGNNPIWTIILAVVGLIPALIMGSINIAIFTAIAVLASIIIHFIKRTVAR